MQLLQKLFTPKPTINHFSVNEPIDLGSKNIIISGLIGTGKTTLCKQLLQQALSDDRYVIVITNDSSYHDAYASQKYEVNFWDHCEIWGRELGLSMLKLPQYRCPIPENSLIIIDEGSMSAIWEATRIKQDYSYNCQVIGVVQSFPSTLERINQKRKQEFLKFYKTFIFTKQSISDANAIANLPGCSEVHQSLGSDLERYDWLELKYS